MSTMNGYIENFTQIGSGQVNGSAFVEADVTVSPSRIINFIATGLSTSSQFDGRSLFAESQREVLQRRSKGEIFDKLLDGFPSSVMKARVVSIAPDDKKAGDFIMKVEVSYSDEWVRALTSGLEALSINVVPVTFSPSDALVVSTMKRLPRLILCTNYRSIRSRRSKYVDLSCRPLAFSAGRQGHAVFLRQASMLGR